MSYSIYLSHMMFLIILKKIINLKQGEDITNFYQFFTTQSVLFIFCLCFCHFVYKFIEKPCYDYGRKLASKIK